MSFERPRVTIGDQTLRVLRNGEEVFVAMLDALAAAHTRIRIEMYWWEADAVGRKFLDALTAASRRGVDVRVVVDAFGSLGLPRDFWKPLLAAGGRVATFNSLPTSLKAPWIRTLRSRNHRKIIVADRCAFVGGLNFAHAWAPTNEGGEDWRDTAIEIRGLKVSDHLAALFAGTWAAVTGDALEHPAPAMAAVDHDEIAIYSNTPSARRGRRIRQAYLRALRQARTSVDITCAYFAPRPLFLRALVQAVRRGVRVRIMVPLHSDVEFAHQASLPLLRWLAHRGVQVFAYGDGILHAKTAVVDGVWCTVGSHNLDGLSWAWNLECNVVLRNKAIAAQLTQLFEDDLRLSVTFPPARIGWLERIFPNTLRRWYSSG